MRDQRPQIPSDFPEALKPLLEKGWSKDALQRPPLTRFREALQKVSDDLEKELAEKTAAQLKSLTLGTPSPESNPGASEANRPSPTRRMSKMNAFIFSKALQERQRHPLMKDSKEIFVNSVELNLKTRGSFGFTRSVAQVVAAIMRDQRPQIPSDFPEALKPLLEKGWSKDALQRPPLTRFREALQKVSDDLEKELAEKTAAQLKSLTLGTPSPESNPGASEANRPSPTHSMSFAGAAAASSEEEVEGIPCEFCGTLLNLAELSNHERRCFNDQMEELNRQEVPILRGRRPQLETSAPDSPAASMPSVSRLSLRLTSRQAEATSITFTLTKRDLQDPNWRSPSKEALGGRLQFHVREANKNLFLCSAMTDISRGQEYEAKFVARVEASKCWKPFCRRHNERFDASHSTNASFLLPRPNLEAIKMFCGDDEAIHFQVEAIALSPVEQRPPSEERSLVIRSAFTSVGGMELLDMEYSAPFFWRGWKAQVVVRRWPESLRVFVSLLRDLDQPSWSCRVRQTVTLRRPSSFGEDVSVTSTDAFSSENFFCGWKFLPWKDVVDPSKGWLTDGRLSVEASISDSVDSCLLM
ncbi:unnamed protein product [Cyprideis torosa]|uniref:Uncharacterized protein n=1 Tax=Cyprideis torosa TaxID=163714 RepID=A0A7R8ZT39_9CRUS|nr:unnamed protein product [Cyprideis torosa]CAG0897300.1 unnamed protein product [Cyprideis torosa]